jgi:hypothetical protein
VWHDLPYVPGAPGAIDALLDRGHSVVFATSRTDVAAAAAEYWHVGSPWRRQTQLVTGLGNSKQSVPCSVYVDDSPDVIENLVSVGRNAVVFDRAWNAHLKVGHRAKDWSEVLDWIEDFR